MACRFELAQNGPGRGSGDVREDGYLFLTYVDFDGRGIRWGGPPAASQAKQYRDATFNVITDHQIVAGPDGHIEVADRHQGEKLPRLGIPADDLTNLWQGKMQQFAVARYRKTDPARLTSDGGCFSEPSPRPREMCEIGSAFSRGDRDAESTTYKTEHAARWVVDVINELPGLKTLEMAPGEDIALKRPRRHAEPALALDNFMGRGDFAHFFLQLIAGGQCFIETYAKQA